MDAETISSSGQITSGLKSHASILSIITFVCEQLPSWRDDPNRLAVESEDRLNSQLYKFLNSQAREHLPMFLFGYEEPQYKRRNVDISVLPSENMIIEARPHTIYDPVLVIECKRLPAPSVGREKEYVTGTSPDKITGGIQRFKLDFHGAKHELAAMVGYIQEQFDKDWRNTINGWIKELIAKPIGDGCVWSDDEILYLLENNTATGIIKCSSKHRRTANNRKIEIYHLWISMRRKSASIRV